MKRRMILLVFAVLVFFGLVTLFASFKGEGGDATIITQNINLTFPKETDFAFVLVQDENGEVVEKVIYITESSRHLLKRIP